MILVFLPYYNAYINETDLDHLRTIKGICSSCKELTDAIEPCCDVPIEAVNEIIDVREYLIYIEREKT